MCGVNSPPARAPEEEERCALKKTPVPFFPPYRDQYGITRPYYPDFIVKTAERMFIVETKAEEEIQKAESDANNPIVLKARATQSWCKTASKVSVENQPTEWEYLVVSDKDAKENSQLGFEGLAGIARATTERLVRSEEGRLLWGLCMTL